MELGEIEAVLREVSGSEVAIAIGWPRSASGADGIVGFVGEGGALPEGADLEAIRRRACDRLPPYMQPRELRLVRDWPLNANGKVDRKALAGLLERPATTETEAIAR